VLIGQLISNVNRWFARKSDDSKTPG